jgi:MFS family permease
VSTPPPATDDWPDTGSYLALLKIPGAAGFFIAASLGRVGVAATGLGLIWLVATTSGSFAAAGMVVGAFAIAEALVGPQVARLIDRYGQTRVLPWLLTAHAWTVAVLVAAVLAGASRPLLGLAGAAVGASIPQLGALSSARWVALLSERREWLPQALAMESVANAFTFLVGPVLVSAVAVGGVAWPGTLGAAVLVVSGGAALTMQRGSAPPVERVVVAAVDVHLAPASVEQPSDTSLSPAGLLSRRFGVLVGLSAVLGVHFGGVGLSVTAWAEEQDSAAVAAALFAVSSGAGLVGAWAYGLRRWRTASIVQLALAAGVLAVGCVVMTAAAGTELVARAGVGSEAIGAGLVLAGAAVPVIVVQLSVLVEAGAVRGVLTQALTWMNSASAAGSAAAGVLTGRTIDAVGARGGFAVTAAAGALLLLLALAGRAGCG